MTGPRDAGDLIASLPAAGSGGATLEQLEKLAGRRGMAYLALPNPASLDALETGRWEAECVDALRRAADQAGAGRVILFGHCMGGLSAVRLSTVLGPALGLPVRVLAVNTPCPDASGRIPTMTQYSDAEIARVLAHDGFPQDLLDDEDMLTEIADGLREDAAIADRLAEWISAAADLETLHVLSTRGDYFIPPEQCAGWRDRVTREFHLTITPGGHTLDETMAGVLERVLDSVTACAQAESA